MDKFHCFCGICQAFVRNFRALQQNVEIARHPLGKTDKKHVEPLCCFPRFSRRGVCHHALGVGRSPVPPQQAFRPRPRGRASAVPKLWLLAGWIGLLVAQVSASASSISPAQAESIGRRLWQNESGETLSGLTAWNAGEDFASLGIGHFIWYPAGVRGPFEESFPPLLRFLEQQGVSLSEWLRHASACPWPNRQAFLAEAGGERMRELRSLLADTVGEQTRFAIDRLERSLPKMLASAKEGERRRIETNFHALETTPGGLFALVDYVNFKGEGTFPTERYQGEGWGLLNVLQAMEPGPALPSFRRAARFVLERRVRNAPPARHEERWLRGWLNRVDGYREGSAG